MRKTGLGLNAENIFTSILFLRHHSYATLFIFSHYRHTTYYALKKSLVTAEEKKELRGALSAGTIRTYT